MTVLLVALGAAVGAPLRYHSDRWISSRHDSVLPWGTLAVNVAGSLLLGVLTGAAGVLPAWSHALAGAGLCGALTTYSTFGYETVRLAEDGSAALGVLSAALNLGVGLAAAFAGSGLALGVWG